VNPGRIPEILAAASPALRALAQVPGLYLVGGWLREAWYGRSARDIDLIATAPLAETVTALEAALGTAAFSLNERFSTNRLIAGALTFDVSPVHPGGIEADLARRDYSVNTLALPAGCLGPEADGSAAGLGAALLAFPGTIEDLSSGVLRMVSEQNLRDDPLRLLRGYRFCAEQGFLPEPQTRAAWQRHSSRLRESAAERIHEELLRWFDQAPGASLRWAAEDGLLWQLFPPLRETVGCTQNDYHHLDVWEHTLDCLTQLEHLAVQLPKELSAWQAGMHSAWQAPVSGRASAATLTRLALLLHDIAKPPTRAVQPEGRISFYGHQELGASMVRELLDDLKFSSDETDFVCLLIAEHLRLGYYSDHSPVSPRLLYRYLSKLGSAAPLMVLHSLADCAGTRGEMAAEGWEKHLRAADSVLRHYFEADRVAHPPLLLDGDAIMALTGLPPGKRIGELKAALLEATAAGEVGSVEEAKAFVRGAQGA